MMVQLPKIGCFTFICILLSSIQGTEAICANITNLTRISATSVLVEWEYHTSLQEFDIHISDYENSSVIQNIATEFIRSVGDRYAYLVNNTANAQLLCFIVSMASDVLRVRSSGDMTVEEMCPKECLPSTPGQIPATPGGFTATNTTTNFSKVKFSWNVMDGLVVLACAPSGGSVPTIIKEFCGSSSPVSVGGFEMPSSQYTCFLSQKSGTIVGHSSEINFITDVPRLSPADFAIAGVNSTEITVQFSRSFGQFSDSESVQIQYEFTTKLQSNGQRVGPIVSNITSTHPTNMTETIRNLYPFTTYEIEFRIQRLGAMNWSYPFRREVVTLEEAPAKIPHNSVFVQTISITPPMLLVAWKPPALANGSIISYEYCWSSGACAMTTGNSTIINLATNSNSDVYTVKVAAITRGGRGLHSDSIYAYIPRAVAPTQIANTSYQNNVGSDRTRYIQLKFKGLNNCSLWLTERAQMSRDIISDLLAQLSNLCNCSLPSEDIKPSQPFQCSTVRTNEILFQAVSSSGVLLDTLEQWIGGPFPYVTVSRLGLQLRLDRSCPLYTSSPFSNECLDTTADEVVLATGGSNGGAVAGALIGGILLGVILTVGIGSVIMLIIWWKQRGHDKKAQMMKKVDPNMGTTLAQRYIPSTENLNLQSSGDYEPVGVYVQHHSGDNRAGNTYESQVDGEDSAKQKKQKKTSNKDSGKQVLEDESGYVVPDSLWEGKQRPVAPGNAASTQTPASKSSKNTTLAPQTTTKVEYDVPEGIEHRDTSKVKGQRELQSAQQVPMSTLGQKEHVQKIQTGKDHQKQKLQAKEPSKTTSQPEQSQSNEVNKPAAAQGGKPAKKNKPKLLQKKENSSKLAVQYQSDASATSFGKSGATAGTGTVAPQQAHADVKSKLQGILTPVASAQSTKAAHAKLTKQPGISTTESAKVRLPQQQQEPQPMSKVMAMAQKLQDVGHTSTSATAGSVTSDSKSPGAKKKPFLLPKTTGSSTATSAQQHQQASGASEGGTRTSHMLPTKKPKPSGKGTANISMKSNTAYEKWSQEEDGIVTPTQNPSGRSYAGGRRGNENVYHY